MRLPSVRLLLIACRLLRPCRAGLLARVRHPTFGAMPVSSPAVAQAKTAAAAWDMSSVGTIDADVFELALNAADCAVRSGDVTHPSTLTVIDYSRPSTDKRLWVFDLRSRELVHEEAGRARTGERRQHGYAGFRTSPKRTPPALACS